LRVTRLRSRDSSDSDGVDEHGLEVGEFGEVVELHTPVVCDVSPDCLVICDNSGVKFRGDGGEERGDMDPIGGELRETAREDEGCGSGAFPPRDDPISMRLDGFRSVG
jgi:hypothetical protein